MHLLIVAAQRRVRAHLITACPVGISYTQYSRIALNFMVGASVLHCINPFKDGYVNCAIQV